MKIFSIDNKYPIRKTKSAKYTNMAHGASLPDNTEVNNLNLSFCANFGYKMEAKALQKQAQKYQNLAQEKVQEAKEAYSKEQDILKSAKRHQQIALGLGEGAFSLLRSSCYRHFPYTESNLEKGIKQRSAQKLPNGNIIIKDEMVDGSKRIVNSNPSLVKVIIQYPNGKERDCYAFDPDSHELLNVFEGFEESKTSIDSKKRYTYIDNKFFELDEINSMYNDADDREKSLHTYIFQDDKLRDYIVLNDSAYEKYSTMNEVFNFVNGRLVSYCDNLKYRAQERGHAFCDVHFEYDLDENLVNVKIGEIAQQEDNGYYSVSRMYLFDNGFKCVHIGAQKEKDEDAVFSKRAYFFEDGVASEVLLGVRDNCGMLLYSKKIKL